MIRTLRQCARALFVAKIYGDCGKRTFESQAVSFLKASAATGMGMTLVYRHRSYGSICCE